jgi:hypothetical protein
MLRLVIIGLSLCVVAAVLGACTHARSGPPVSRFAEVKAVPPRGNTITVCHAYGCKLQTKVRLSPKDVAEIKTLMKKTMKADTAEEERRGVAYVVGWLERTLGERVGTSGDRAGMEFNGPGDPTQMDCVDESMNTTSYLLVLEHNGFLKHHRVGTPFAKDNLIRGVAGWTHWTAVLEENAGGKRWAVDSWIYANGENPAVVEAEKWYIEDLNSLPKPKV